MKEITDNILISKIRVNGKLFCNSVLTHPIWKQSKCPIHG